MVVGQAEDHRVVEHTALIVDHGRIQAPAGRHCAQIPGSHQLGEPGGVRPPQLHLALAADVPYLHVLPEVPVIFFHAPAEALGQDGVIDHRITGDAQLFDPVGIGGGANPA